MKNCRLYPEYKDSEIEWLGKIPAHWEIRRCGSTTASSQDGVRGNEVEIEKLEGEIIEMLQEVAE